MSKIIDALFVDSPIGMMLAAFLGIAIFMGSMGLMIDHFEQREANRRNQAVAAGCIAIDNHVFCQGAK